MKPLAYGGLSETEQAARFRGTEPLEVVEHHRIAVGRRQTVNLVPEQREVAALGIVAAARGVLAGESAGHLVLVREAGTVPVSDPHRGRHQPGENARSRHLSPPEEAVVGGLHGILGIGRSDDPPCGSNQRSPGRLHKKCHRVLITPDEESLQQLFRSLHTLIMSIGGG
jgi:hypothetical protein